MTLHEGARFRAERGQHRQRQFDAGDRHHRPPYRARRDVAPDGPQRARRQGDRHLISARSRWRATAQQTDGEQSVKAMLLDRGATANCQARAGDLRRRREMRAWRDGRRAGREPIVLRRGARARPGAARGAAARRLRRRPVGRDRRRRPGHRRRWRARRCGRSRHERRRRSSTPRSRCATSSRRSPAGIISTAPRPRRSRRR